MIRGCETDQHRRQRLVRRHQRAALGEHEPQAAARANSLTNSVRNSGSATSLAGWTEHQIDLECKAGYDAFLIQTRARHIEYFAARPERRSETRAFLARSREAAFPDGWGNLADSIAPDVWHRHHLSAGSSQVLAIALLAAATRADSSLRWIPGEPRLRRPLTLFEVEIAPTVLNEAPRQTSIDWLVVDREHVIAAEAKFTEPGLGRCSCEHRAAGQCSERVLERPYWQVASRDMAIDHTTGLCSLSLGYQAVRNVAAAQAIAGERRHSTFLLLYDARNPYFVGARSWPGWVRMLNELMRNSTTDFVALSWQQLLRNVDLDARVRQWGREKHGLAAEQSPV